MFVVVELFLDAATNLECSAMLVEGIEVAPDEPHLVGINKRVPGVVDAFKKEAATSPELAPALPLICCLGLSGGAHQRPESRRWLPDLLSGEAVRARGGPFPTPNRRLNPLSTFPGSYHQESVE